MLKIINSLFLNCWLTYYIQNKVLYLPVEYVSLGKIKRNDMLNLNDYIEDNVLCLDDLDIQASNRRNLSNQKETHKFKFLVVFKYSCTGSTSAVMIDIFNGA